MASFSQVRPTSPTNTVVRKCTAKNNATDSVLNCILFNYLQHDLEPSPNRNTGFFASQSIQPIELFSRTFQYSAYEPLTRHRSIFSPPDIVSVTIRITARKYRGASTSPDIAISDECYFLEATASAFDSEHNFVVRNAPLRVILNDPQDLQQKMEWDHLEFEDVVKLLRWISKVKYDSMENLGLCTRQTRSMKR